VLVQIGQHLEKQRQLRRFHSLEHELSIVREVEARTAATTVVLTAFKRALKIKTRMDRPKHTVYDLVSEYDLFELCDAVARHFDLLGVAVLLRQFTVGPLAEVLHVEPIHPKNDVSAFLLNLELLLESLESGLILSIDAGEVREFTDTSQDAVLGKKIQFVGNLADYLLRRSADLRTKLAPHTAIIFVSRSLHLVRRGIENRPLRILIVPLRYWLRRHLLLEVLQRLDLTWVLGLHVRLLGRILLILRRWIHGILLRWHRLLILGWWHAGVSTL
jgi:hypothetical protein